MGPEARGNLRTHGLRRIAGHAWQAAVQLTEHEGFELSGYAAFTALLALFPFLLFLTSLAGFIGDEDVAERLIADSFDFAPKEVVNVLRPAIVEVLTQRHGSLLTMSFVVAFWSASSGVEALRTILNRSYDLKETRRIWVLRPQSCLIVFFGSMFAILAPGVLLFGPQLDGLLRRLNVAQPFTDAMWTSLRYGIVGVLVTILLMFLHLSLPNARLSWRMVWPGTVVTVILWLVGASLFSIYVETFANYSITYGSLGGIILTLLFFYVTAILFTYGAEFNAALRTDDPVAEDALPHWSMETIRELSEQFRDASVVSLGDSSKLCALKPALADQPVPPNVVRTKIRPNGTERST